MKCARCVFDDGSNCTFMPSAFSMSISKEILLHVDQSGNINETAEIEKYLTNLANKNIMFHPWIQEYAWTTIYTRMKQGWIPPR